MVSPLVKLSRKPGDRSRRTPMGMSVVSPSESISIEESPLDVKTPARRLLFARTPAPSSRNDESRDQQSEVEQLRTSCKKKDTQIRVLHDRFHSIQQGLGSIDEERSALVEKAKKLEKEKKYLQKQLELREREILTLVKRCASQEEYMRESSKVRSQNREMVNAFESVQSRRHNSENGNDELYTLRKKLQQSELAREELQEKLAKVQREYDSIADTLQECLANIRQLTDEKQQIEDERRRERKRAEIELEKQRLAHIQASNTFKEDIEAQQNRIQQMERILQDNMRSKTSLRRQSIEQKEEVQEVVRTYEKKLSGVQDKASRSLRVKEEECERQIQQMMKKMNEKEGVIQDLETEFSDQMLELMKKSSSLDEAEEENRNLESRIEASKDLENEYSALQEFVGILDSNLADMTSENAHLLLERDNLQEEADRLKNKACDLEKQLLRIQESRKVKEGDFPDLIYAEKEELKIELEAALAQAREEAATLQAELVSRGEWITKLEQEVKDTRRTIVLKEEEIRRIKLEKEELRSTLQIALAEAREEVSKLEEELLIRDHKLMSMDDSLGKLKRSHLTETKNVLGIEKQCEDPRDEFDEKRDPTPKSDAEIAEEEVDQLRKEIMQERTTKFQVRRELQERIDEGNKTVENLHLEISSLVEKCSSLTQDIETANMSLGERDSRVRSLEKSQSHNEQKRKELEKSLAEATLEIESYQAKIELLEMTNSSLEIEVEAGRVTMEKEEETIRELHSNLTSNAEEANTELDEKDHEIGSLKQEHNKLQNQLSVARKGLVERESQIKELEAYYVESQRLKEETNKSLKIANEKILFLDDQLSKKTKDVLEQELEAAKQALSKQERDYSETLQTQSEREVHNRNLCSRIAVLEEHRDASNQRSAELEIELKSIKNRLSKKEQKIKEVEQQHAEADTKRKTLEQKLSDTQKLLDTVQNELDQKKTACSSLEKEFNFANQSLSEQKDRITSMKSKLAANEEAQAVLEKNLAEANSQVSTLEDELDCVKDNALSLEDQLEEAKRSLAEKDAFLKDNEMTMENKSLEYSELESTHQSVEYVKEELKQALAQTKSQVVSMEQEIECLKKNSADVELELERIRATKDAETLAWEEKELLWDDREKSLKEELTGALDAMVELDDRIICLESDLEEKVESTANQERTLLEANQTIASLEDQKQNLEDTRLSLEQDILTTRSSMNEKYGYLEEKHADICESLANKEKHVASLEQNSKVNEEQKAALELSLSEAQEEIALLEKGLNVRDQKIVSLENEVENLSTNEIEEAFVQSEKERMELEGLLAGANSKIETLGKNLAERESRLLEIDQALENSRNTVLEKDGSINAALGRCTELEKQVTSLDDLVESREDRLLKVDEELEAAKKNIAEKDSEIDSLQLLKESLQASLGDSNGEASSLRKMMESKEECLVQVQERLTEEEKKNKAYQAVLGEETDKVSSLKEELETTKVSLESTERTLQGKISDFEGQVRKLETELALKDDEIRELRLVELKDAEDAIAKLTTDLENLQHETKKKETATSKKIEALETEKETWKEETDELIRLADLTNEEHTKQLKSFEQQKQLFERMNDSMGAQLSDRNRRLEETQATVVSLTKQNESLKHQEQELRAEREQLHEAQDISVKEVEKMKKKMEDATIEAREDADKRIEEKDVAHREEVAELTEKLQSTAKKSNEVEHALKERSTLLGEMVEHNKDLEVNLESMKIQISFMEDERNQEKDEIEQTEKDLSKAREELSQKEKVITKKLRDGNMVRETAEKALARMKKQYNEAVKVKKSVADLETENATLKDKVSRQEAYLQRKLQKEKTLKNRMSPIPGTPPRQKASPRKVMLSTQSICSETSSRASSCIPGPNTTRSRLQTPTKHTGSKIPDWELEVE